MNPDNHHEIAERIYTENHQRAARTLARRYGRPASGPDIQDAISAATMRLIEHLRRGGEIADEAAWFAVVVHREYLRHYRTPAYRNSRPLTLTVEDTHPDNVPSPEGALIDDATDAGIRRALDQALGRLSPLQREVITAQASGLTYAQITKRTGLSYTAVNKAIQRARRNLKIDGRLEQQLKQWRA